MPRSTQTVRVAPIPGEPFRYKVESWSAGKLPHTVDLLDEGGLGRCDCENFQFACLNSMKARPGIFVPFGRKGATECRHLHAARMKESLDRMKAEAIKRRVTPTSQT